jgi:hypothetical protein
MIVIMQTGTCTCQGLCLFWRRGRAVLLFPRPPHAADSARRAGQAEGRSCAASPAIAHATQPNAASPFAKGDADPAEPFASGQEMWTLVIEKAYAQLRGGHDAIARGGRPERAASTECPRRSASRRDSATGLSRARHPGLLALRARNHVPALRHASSSGSRSTASPAAAHASSSRP